MCGRYTLGLNPETLAEHFELDATPRDLEPRYNIAPGQRVAVITAVKDRGRHLDFMHWGLVPSWADDKSIGRRLVNARAETVAEKPAFRSAFHHRRCLIPADGYYEWQAAEPHKTPYWIGRPDRGPLGLAGLWERWEDRNTGETVDSCLILTCVAGAPLQAIGMRMPLILTPEDYGPWLAADTAAERLQSLMHAYRGPLRFHRVSPDVNNPRNDYDALTRPVAT